MGDWPVPILPTIPRATIALNSIGVCPISLAISAAGSDLTVAAAWPAANRVIYVPFTLSVPFTVKQMGWVNGTVNAAANIDLGVYDISKTKLVSTGSTAMSGANQIQIVDVTDTVLVPGYYWAGMVVSTVTTATFFRTAIAALLLNACGLQQEASGVPLPGTATFANPASAYCPRFILWGNTVI